MVKEDPIKYLGIDWGEKRIGLAMADSETKLAIPLSSVSNIKELKEIVADEEIDVLVLGRPVKMSGERDELTPDFLKFSDRIKNDLPEVKIEMLDERLTSKQADSLPGEKRDKASRDEVAAMLILQDYLDSYGRDV